MAISHEGVMYKQKLIGFGLGAAPRAQIRGVFVCTLPLHEISRCEHFFTADKVLHFFGALPRDLDAWTIATHHGYYARAAAING